MDRFCQRIFGVGLVIVCWACQAIAGEPTDVRALRNHLLSVMPKIRAGERTTYEEEKSLLSADPLVAFEALRAFEKDQSPEVRSYVYRMEGKLLFRGHLPLELRRRLIESQVRAMCIEPEDVMDAFYDFRVWRHTNAEDFTEQAKDLLRAHLTRPEPRHDVILMSGLADLQDQIPRLKELRAEEVDYVAAVADDPEALTYLNIVKGWYERLALARLGSLEDIAHCIEKIEAVPDFEFRVSYFLPQYGYIRQPEVIPILQRYLERDDLVDEGVTRAGYYAQKILEEIVKGFPAKTDLATARAWMQAQTEFTITR